MGADHHKVCRRPRCGMVQRLRGAVVTLAERWAHERQLTRDLTVTNLSGLYKALRSMPSRSRSQHRVTVQLPQARQLDKMLSLKAVGTQFYGIIYGPAWRGRHIASLCHKGIRRSLRMVGRCEQALGATLACCCQLAWLPGISCLPPHAAPALTRACSSCIPSGAAIEHKPSAGIDVSSVPHAIW